MRNDLPAYSETVQRDKYPVHFLRDLTDKRW